MRPEDSRIKPEDARRRPAGVPHVSRFWTGGEAGGTGPQKLRQSLGELGGMGLTIRRGRKIAKHRGND
jgi:hypothetical protein